MRSKLRGADGLAHTRKDFNVSKKGMPRGTAYHENITPKEEIELCLTCPLKTCRPEGCTRLTNICKNCKHLQFSDCYGECSKGYISGIVHPYDSCKHFEKRSKK